MTTKNKNIINWVLIGSVGLIFIGSAFSNFYAEKHYLQSENQ
jgi:hypothetical protein